MIVKILYVNTLHQFIIFILKIHCKLLNYKHTHKHHMI